jgi:hypothetical protein
MIRITILGQRSFDSYIQSEAKPIRFAIAARGTIVSSKDRRNGPEREKSLLLIRNPAAYDEQTVSQSALDK